MSRESNSLPLSSGIPRVLKKPSDANAVVGFTHVSWILEDFVKEFCELGERGRIFAQIAVHGALNHVLLRVKCARGS